MARFVSLRNIAKDVIVISRMSDIVPDLEHALERNKKFGKEAGMYAGLSNAKGDFVVVMDADLQHPPAFLPKMYSYVRNGEYDCATTRRVSRQGESKIRSWFARLFSAVIFHIQQYKDDHCKRKRAQ